MGMASYNRSLCSAPGSMCNFVSRGGTSAVFIDALKKIFKIAARRAMTKQNAVPNLCSLRQPRKPIAMELRSATCEMFTMASRFEYSNFLAEV